MTHEKPTSRSVNSLTAMSMTRGAAVILIVAWTLILLADPGPTEVAATSRPVRTLLGGEYWGFELTPAYVDYLAEVRPDLIHAGVLGPELASTIASAGRLTAITPLNLDGIISLQQYHAHWRTYLEKVHALDVRVQTTFSLINLWGDHEQNIGFFQYYRDLWEEDFLGPRPRADVGDLLERDAVGNFIRDGQSGWYRYGGCVNNPHWRTLLKAMVKRGIEAGFDGFMVQFPHARGPCACPHCQEKFGAFMKSHYDAKTLIERFGIREVDQHLFEATGPRPGMPEPIDIAARQFTAECVKDCFDEVFVHYGRSLKRDLVLSMWTHFRQFLHPDVMGTEEMTNTDFAAWVDERALLSRDRWGAGEDYLWYSSPVYQTRLKGGLLGDNTLDYKYLRAMAGPRPFHVLKYEYFRWRLTVGEALAHGGIAFGAWKGGWSGGQDREEPHLKSYFQFIRNHDALLFPRESYADVALIYPRTAEYSGDVRFLEPVRRLGAGLMAGHILFDILIDERLNPESLAPYPMVILPAAEHLTPFHQELLDRYVATGGQVVVLPSRAPPEDGSSPRTDDRGRTTLWANLNDKEALSTALREIGGAQFSQFDAPWTVQINADRQPATRRLLVHLVNYHRDESRPGHELPIPAEPVSLNLRLPPNLQIRRVSFFTPEMPHPQRLEFEQSGGRLRTRSPAFLVYGIIVMEHEPPALP